MIKAHLQQAATDVLNEKCKSDPMYLSTDLRDRIWCASSDETLEGIKAPKYRDIRETVEQIWQRSTELNQAAQRTLGLRLPEESSNKSI
jgi:hypothetical protein